MCRRGRIPDSPKVQDNELMSALRFILKTTAATAFMFIFIYEAAMLELTLYWFLTVAMFLLGAVIEWKMKYARFPARIGLRLAYRSWYRPDAPRVL
jgi:hypothetical protein